MDGAHGEGCELLRGINVASAGVCLRAKETEIFSTHEA